MAGARADGREEASVLLQPAAGHPRPHDGPLPGMETRLRVYIDGGCLVMFLPNP
jgi:hypothetical protein